MKIGVHSLNDFASFLVRRRWWIIAPFIALTCLVAILTKELPKVFVSESLVLVRPRDVPENFVMNLSSTSVEQRLKSIQAMVMSRSNIEQLLADPLLRPRMRELTALPVDEAIERLRKQIGVNFVFERDSRGLMQVIAFGIRCEDRDPYLAQDMAKKLTALFQEQELRERSFSVTGTTNFLSGELEKQDEQLQASDTSLKTLKGKHLYELPERLEGNQRDLDRLHDAKRANTDALSRLNSTKLGYEQLMTHVPEFLPGQPKLTPEEEAKERDPNLDLYLSYKAAFDKEKAIRGPGHPDYEQAKAKMERTKALVSPEALADLDKPKPAKKELEAGEKIKNPTYTNFQVELARLKTEFDILNAEKRVIDEAIARVTRRVNNTPQVELELTGVIRDNNDLRRQRDELNNDLTKARLAASLETRQATSQFMLQDPANLPAEAEKPNKWAVLGIGSLISLALAIGFAFLVDLARQRVWTQSEIESFWGVPVMVDIPAIVSDSDQAALRKKRLAFATFFLAGFAVYGVFLYGVYLNNASILRQLDPVLQTLVYR